MRKFDVKAYVPEKLLEQPLYKIIVELLDDTLQRDILSAAPQISLVKDKWSLYQDVPVFNIEHEVDFKNVTIPQWIAPLSFNPPLISHREQVFDLEPDTDFEVVAGVDSLQTIAAIENAYAGLSIVEIIDNEDYDAQRSGYFNQGSTYRIRSSGYHRVVIRGTISAYRDLAIKRITEKSTGLTYHRNRPHQSTLLNVEQGNEYVVQLYRPFKHTFKGVQLNEEAFAELAIDHVALIREMGYGYILDILELSPIEIVTFKTFLLSIHRLKGSRQGVDFILDLLDLRQFVTIVEWFDEVEEVDRIPSTYRIEIDLTREDNRVNFQTAEKVRQFFRAYVYPLLREYGVIINMIDQPLYTAVNFLPRQVVVGTTTTPARFMVGGAIEQIYDINVSD